MTVLGEAHNEEELENLVNSKVKLIGINARNLNTFTPDLDAAAKLIAQVPYDRIAIAESAITSHNDVQVLSEAGARGFLVGETLMRAEHPGEKLKELLG
jgi:indole-3-glycerol phosphate synthase